MTEPKAYKGKLGDFKPDLRNLNRHTQRGRRMVEVSQRQRGFGRPGFAAKDKTMLGGNLSIMEVASDIDLGNGDVFVVETDGDIPIIHLRRDIEPGTDKAILLAAEDNQSALVSIDFDPERLAEEIAQGVDFGGVFMEEEQESILDGLVKEPPEEHGSPQIDRADELRQEWGTELGQLWALGEHRLVVGDCMDRRVVERVTEGDVIQGIVTDPPYSFGLSSTSQMATKSGGWHDMMNNASWFSELYREWEKIITNGPLWVFCNWRTLPILMRATFDSSVGIDSLMVWYKDWIGPGGMKGLRPTYELIAFTAIGNYAIPDRNIQDFIKIPWSSHKPTGHRAEKPLDLLIELLKISEINLILDPFLGSGTTLMAAHQLNRRCRGIEIDPGYAAVTLQRFLDHTGVKPELIPNL